MIRIRKARPFIDGRAFSCPRLTLVEFPIPHENPNRNPPHPMAITLTSDYSKKLGLPGFSSHQFSVSIQTELTDLDQVPSEISRLYQLLQGAVDHEIQQTGFVPGHDYGEVPNNGHHHLAAPAPASTAITWNCSDKQRQLLGDLAAELQLSDDQLDARARRLFQMPAHQLNKLAASGLISDLLAEAGGKRQRNGNGGNDNGGHRSNGNGAHQRSQAAAPASPTHRNGGGA